jgi:hypothetical protein
MNGWYDPRDLQNQEQLVRQATAQQQAYFGLNRETPPERFEHPPPERTFLTRLRESWLAFWDTWRWGPQ